MLEAVIGLPDQLFYNTGISTYVWIVTNRKGKERAGKVQLINAVDFAWKMTPSLGDKRKFIGDGSDGSPDHIDIIANLYGDFVDNVRLTAKEIQTNVDTKQDSSRSMYVSRIFQNQEFGYLKLTIERPMRLNFAVSDERIARFKTTRVFTELAISRKRKDKKKIAEEQLLGAKAQAALLGVLESMKPSFKDGALIKSRDSFETSLQEAFETAGIELDSVLRNSLLSPGSLGERDPSADICYDKKGNPEPDPELRDTENIPLPIETPLPLPLEYESKKNKNKVAVDKLCELMREYCEEYLKSEVHPYRSDSWIDYSKIKVGYEISFPRYFLEYEDPDSLAAIEAATLGYESKIFATMKELAV